LENREESLIKSNISVSIVKPVEYQKKVLEYLMKGLSPTTIADKLGVSVGEIYDLLQNPAFHDMLQNVVNALLPGVEQQVINTTSELIESIRSELKHNKEISLKDKVKVSESLFTIFNKLLDMTVKLKEISSKSKVREDNPIAKLIATVIDDNVIDAEYMEDADIDGGNDNAER